MNQWRYPASSGGEIQAYGWQGQGEPRAIVQFVHGIAEHAARYDEFAQALCAKGIWVVAEDHMGHGGSMGETAGYFSGGWLAAVQGLFTRCSRRRVRPTPVCRISSMATAWARF